ncbi:polysaccharide biosynthesis C-terminal domain-containing protein, partial [Vibrio alginolyticus]|nr:polysaccharide biosynthesis C-terminal domain-containing protein [Vibrio alginolyticus]
YKTDFLFRCSFFSLILFLSVIYPLTNYYDELGLIVSILISYSYNCVFLWVNCKRITGIRIKTNKHTLLYFIVSIFSVIIFEFLNFSNEYYKLCVSVLVVTTLHSWGWYLYLKRIK